VWVSFSWGTQLEDVDLATETNVLIGLNGALLGNFDKAILDIIFYDVTIFF